MELLIALLSWLVSAAAAASPDADRLGAAGTTESSDTVHVAPPTRVRETDRASILAALEAVRPGGTVQFAQGTYLVGELISSETPRITLLGHPEGTTLRGCEPDEYEQSERAIAAAATAEAAMIRAAWIRCGMLELTGGNVTVRNLTFELSRMGLLLGCCHLERRFGRSEGGYLIEGNTFRNSANGIRPWTTERSVIRGNRFVNTFHAVSGAGSNLHVLDNDISAPEPGQVPGIGHPSFAIALGPIERDAAESIGLDVNGEGNVIAGNRIDGHPDGIFIAALPGTRFRNNEIRDNTIRVARVPIPPSGVRPFIVNVTAQSDTTIVGIPLLLYPQRFPGAPDQDVEEGTFEDNLIARNQFIGAEGVAIAIRRGSRNRIVENTIRGIRERWPFPGNTVGSSSERWQEANGSGVWISAESEGNEIVGNIFDDIAAYTVVLEGDSNRVMTRSAGDRVRDLGTGNQVSPPGGAAGQTLPPGVEKPDDAAEVFPIWPGSPPGTAVTGQPEQVTAAMGGPAGRWVRNVEVPTLTAFLPDPASATGTAVVVAPGGGNLFLSIDHEGYAVARWFAERGVAAFVLRYRVRPTPREPAAFADRLRQVMTAAMSGENPDPDSSRRWSHAADDGRQAIRIIRERSEQWNIDPRRIGIVGFSAGGFVVNDVAVEYDESSRPDFAASIYAGLLGPIAVPEDAPPLFIAYAVNDPLMSGRVLPLFAAWRDAGRPVELHAYETGGHGFGISVQNTTSDRWIDAFRAWLAHHGLVSDAPDEEPS